MSFSFLSQLDFARAAFRGSTGSRRFVRLDARLKPFLQAVP